MSASQEFVTPFSHQVYEKNQVNGVVESYASQWTQDGTNDDENRKRRMANYAEVTNKYYNLATDFYEYGWGSSFHFAPIAYNENLDKAIARHEHFLALQLGLRPEHLVADLGCGIGGPMREIATFSGAKIIGVNNNEYQCKRGRELTRRAGLSDQCSFVKGDFMKLEFEGSKFDAVYGIEAICHAPELSGVYSEIFRILKPGGFFACYEWCMTDKFDPSNPDHLRIKRGIEIGDGISDLRTTATVISSLKNAGFEVLNARDMQYDGVTPWYSPLDATWSLSGFQRTKIGRVVTDVSLSLLEFVGLAPKGTQQVSQLLITASDNLIEGGKTGIFTPMYFFLVRKPQRN